MTLENYILEQNISTASISDIEADQIYAEMQVACALVDVYLKQAVIQEYSQTDISEFELYTESDSKIKEKLTNAGTAAGAAIKNFFKKMIEALYRFTRMIIDKIRGQEFSAAIKKLEKMDPNTMLMVDILELKALMAVLEQSKVVLDLFKEYEEGFDMVVLTNANLKKKLDEIKERITYLEINDPNILGIQKRMSVYDLIKYYRALQDKTVIDELRNMNKTLGKMLKPKTPLPQLETDNLELFKDIFGFLIKFYNRYTKAFSKTTKYILADAAISDAIKDANAKNADDNINLNEFAIVDDYDDDTVQEGVIDTYRARFPVAVLTSLTGIFAFPFAQLALPENEKNLAKYIKVFAEKLNACKTDNNTYEISHNSLKGPLKKIIRHSDISVLRFTSLTIQQLREIRKLNSDAIDALNFLTDLGGIAKKNKFNLSDRLEAVVTQGEKVLNLLKENNE